MRERKLKLVRNMLKLREPPSGIRMKQCTYECNVTGLVAFRGAKARTRDPMGFVPGDELFDKLYS